MSTPSSSPPPVAAPKPAAPRKGGRAVRWVLGGVAAVVAGVVVCEIAGWPFLVKPLERTLAKAMQRDVRIGDDAGGTARIHLFGGIRVDAAGLRIGAPDWSRQPYFVDATGIELSLPYASLWRMRRGETLYVKSLAVDRIGVHAERDAQGRSSWQFGEASGKPKAAGTSAIPQFGRLQVKQGDVTYDDALLKLQIQATVQTDEGTQAGKGGGLKVAMKGRYDKSALSGTFASSGALALVAADAPPVPVRLALDVGRMSLRFAGTARDVLSLGGLTGVFKVSGPSLAAVGEPLNVTLPSTGAFALDGRLRKDDLLWNVVVDHATVGTSRLKGAFQYDRRPDVPRLQGELKGERVLLGDLAPTVGAAPAGQTTPPTPSGRKLPQREFDLPSLKAMNADIAIDVARLELGEVFAQPLSPLRARLVLQDGVLTIDQLDATTAEGRLRGMVRLDGTSRPARWNTDLRWNDVNLARWLLQPRKGNQPPYLTGRLDGQAVLKGTGNSTAQLLASTDGRLRVNVRGGTVSHLVVEGAGIDLAQALGMLIKGDDALKMNCAVADFAVKDGVLRPNAALVDTSDSLISVGGSVSLAQEKLDLRAEVEPKDFSPLALRSPILVRGTFAAPKVSLEPGPIGRKVAGSVLLGLINPLAAIIPLLDFGDKKEAQADGCQTLVRKFKTDAAKPAAPAAAPSEAAKPAEAGKAPAAKPRAAMPRQHP